VGHITTGLSVVVPALGYPPWHRYGRIVERD
jgi:uncharacterized membrane protein